MILDGRSLSSVDPTVPNTSTPPLLHLWRFLPTPAPSSHRPLPHPNPGPFLTGFITPPISFPSCKRERPILSLRQTMLWESGLSSSSFGCEESDAVELRMSK